MVKAKLWMKLSKRQKSTGALKMTEFKEGDEVLVLVKATVVSRGEHFNEGLTWLKGGVTNADDFVVHTTDITPASVLDVNKELLDALKPFAKLAAVFDDDAYDSWGIACESTGPIKIRDLRRARDAVAAAEKGA